MVACLKHLSITVLLDILSLSITWSTHNTCTGCTVWNNYIFPFPAYYNTAWSTWSTHNKGKEACSAKFSFQPVAWDNLTRIILSTLLLHRFNIHQCTLKQDLHFQFNLMHWLHWSQKVPETISISITLPYLSFLQDVLLFMTIWLRILQLYTNPLHFDISYFGHPLYEENKQFCINMRFDLSKRHIYLST